MASIDELLAEIDGELARRAAKEQAKAGPPPENGNSRAVQVVDDAGRLFADGASFGFADKFAAKGDSVLNNALDVVGLGDKEKLDYEKNLAAERERTGRARQRLGWGGTAAEIGGAIMSPVGVIARPFQAASTGGRVLMGAGEGAALAGLDAAGHDTPLTAANVAMSAGIGGALGAIGRGPAAGNLTPEQRRLAQVLDREGVTLSAGQATQSKPVKWLESVLADMPLSGAPAARVNDTQARQFNAAVARRMGEQADKLTPDVMDRAATRIGKTFDDLSARNVVTLDPTFATEMSQAVRYYGRKLESQVKPIFENSIMDLASAARQNGGALPGQVYQTARSDLSRLAKGYAQKDPTLAEALKRIRDALDKAAERSIQPQDAGKWATANRQYANMKTIEKAISGAGEKVAAGDISPSQLRTAVKLRDPTAYVRGKGDLAELSRAGEALLKPLPNSGTAPRMMWGNAIANTLGGAAIGSPGMMAAGLGPLAGGALASRLLYSSPVQSWLRNGALGGPAGMAGRPALYGAYGAGLLGATDPRAGRQ